MRLPEYDCMVETFPADCADQPLHVRILPRRSGSGRLVPNAQGAQPLHEERAICSVAVPDKITRCTVPGKGLDDLARNTLRGRICRHPERYPQSTLVTQNHKAIEQPERNRRQHEEVDCRDAIDMIGRKGPPALRWRPAPVHIACDRRLRDCETEIEQFTVNVWCAPEVICTAHRADEIAQLGRDSRPANAVCVTARASTTGTPRDASG
jgi:hypothetical protein